MFKKIQLFVEKISSVMGLVLAIMAAIVAFQTEAKKHYSNPENKQENEPSIQ